MTDSNDTIKYVTIKKTTNFWEIYDVNDNLIDTYDLELTRGELIDILSHHNIIVTTKSKGKKVK
jgi:hypothetical protein